MVNKSPGRPRGGSSARQRLLDTARAHFDAGDLDELSSRDLAAEASVSHSLVNYHFGSRDTLLAEAISVRLAPHQVIERCRDADGRIEPARLAASLIAVWEHPVHGERLRIFAQRLASGGSQAAALTAYLQRTVFAALVEDFGREAGRRMATSIVGVVYLRYVLRFPAFTSLSRQETSAHLQGMLR